MDNPKVSNNRAAASGHLANFMKARQANPNLKLGEFMKGRK